MVFFGGEDVFYANNLKCKNCNMDFLQEVFPSEFLNTFEITNYYLMCDIKTRSDYFLVNLDERYKVPPNHTLEEYESKGFSTPVIIQDFPIRGKAVYLNIRTRLWRNKMTRKIVKNDHSYIAEGIKMTKELSDFLKGTGQYTS